MMSCGGFALSSSSSYIDYAKSTAIAPSRLRLRQVDRDCARSTEGVVQQRAEVDEGGNGIVHLSMRVPSLTCRQTLEGKRSWASITMAIDDFYAAHANYSTRATELLSDVGVQVIIGPPKSTQADFVLVLGNHTRVPILSLSATSPSLSTVRTPYFVQTTLNDSSEVGAIAAVVKSFGWRNVVPVYDDTDYGTGAIPYLIDALHAVDAVVPYRS
ncbi:hypothetical protein GW17_00053901, partial [Ensete ventricosum]